VVTAAGPPGAIAAVAVPTLPGLAREMMTHEGIDELSVLTDSLPEMVLLQSQLRAKPELNVSVRDVFTDRVLRAMPQQIGLELVVQRGEQSVPVAFTPRSVTFFPTQIYETVSMILLTVLLVCFQPFRRQDGQVMVLLMAGYATHRFLNEAIRTEPTYAMGLTLSQWISVGIFGAAVLLEGYLRLTQPRLPPGAVPLGFGSVAVAEPPATRNPL
jgi:hypothetical protein